MTTKKVKPAPSELDRYVQETAEQSAKDDADRRDDMRTSPFGPLREHDRLNGATLALPSCGCNVTGRGTLPFPIRIVFCPTHAKL